MVGIVDGYFHQVGAVRHKEILALLSEGLRVLGAASMGALRAAELDVFGMEGVGRIYADYRDGRLEADDEVTLLHSTPEEDHRPLSEPLVCMRATLSRAVEDGVCDSATAARLVATLAGWPFGRRSYGSLVAAGKEAGIDAEAVRHIREYCVTHRLDPKRDDALLLLDALHRASRGEHSPPPDVPAVNRTSFLYLWQTAASGLGIGDSPHHGHLGALRACQLFAAEYPRFHREVVLRALATACAEECGPIPPAAGDPTPAHIALRHGEHRGLYRLPADPARLGFLAQWLTGTERDTLAPTEQLITFLVRSFRVNPGLTWEELSIQQLQDQPGWKDARQIVQLAWEVNDRVFTEHQERHVNDLSSEKILDLFAQRWEVARADLELAAMDRGLESLDSLTMAARAFYLLARYNPQLVHLEILQPDKESRSG
ncbi:TfuA domain-containing protein [Amycolatopsis sp. DG1A-15b]|uniref:TfuA domain-containing protein n=1 Tax=Amycolatopsis sp. DG1A-15b TaxID=3052846 RepID=UPI00255BB8F5|nr:TfuA domain-containing protein [Amycolatopsis sp. DG1A-15b]WIX91741.1 TfuA domain-containing protein [Amycolatopsis sp. DG1A-15b]